MALKVKIIIISTILPCITLIYGIITKQYNITLDSSYTIASIAVFALIHKRNPTLSSATYYTVILFILLSVFAGKVFNFYSIIPYWDKMLHFLSGFIIASAGEQIYLKYNGNKRLIDLFILSFSIAAAGIWEIYEFTVDGLFGLQSQNGSLNDSMWDMIAGTASAVIWIIIIKIIKKLRNR